MGTLDWNKLQFLRLQYDLIAVNILICIFWSNREILREIIFLRFMLDLTLSWRRSQSYRNQSHMILLCKLIDWFLYDRNLCHARVNKSFFSQFPKVPTFRKSRSSNFPCRIVITLKILCKLSPIPPENRKPEVFLYFQGV